MPDQKSIVGFQRSVQFSQELAREIKQARGIEGAAEDDRYSQLRLRQGLNKIAHADPRNADFYVGPGDKSHDLILSGDYRGRPWIAVVSVIKIIEAVKAHPDHDIIKQ